MLYKVSDKQLDIERRGHFLRKRANILSVGRGVLGLATGVYIGMSSDYHSFKLAGGMGLLAYSDKQDGIDGRESDRLLDVSPDPKNGMKDNLGDKAFVHGFKLGKTIHHARHKQWARAGIFAASSVTQGIRDLAVTKKRNEIIAFNEQHEEFDPISTSATTLSKRKTGLQLTSIILDASPLGNTPLGEIIVIGGVLASDALSLVTAVQITTDLNTQLAERQHIAA